MKYFVSLERSILIIYCLALSCEPDALNSWSHLAQRLASAANPPSALEWEDRDVEVTHWVDAGLVLEVRLFL